MYLRVIKAHISRIFNELDKLKGIYPEYFEKTDVIYYDVSVKSEICHLHHIIITSVFFDL